MWLLNFRILRLGRYFLNFEWDLARRNFLFCNIWVMVKGEKKKKIEKKYFVIVLIVVIINLYFLILIWGWRLLGRVDVVYIFFLVFLVRFFLFFSSNFKVSLFIGYNFIIFFFLV